MNAIVTALLISLFANADESRVPIMAKRIVYKDDNPIIIKSERVLITPNQIEVRHQLANVTPKCSIEFALPDTPYIQGDTTHIIPSWDQLFTAHMDTTRPQTTENQGIILTSHPSYYQPAFLNFQIQDEQQVFKSTLYARAVNTQGKDITSLLLDNKIPLSASFITGFMDETAFDSNPDLKGKVEKLDLLTNDGFPRWHLEYSFKGPLNSKSKNPIITHSYKPHDGLSLANVTGFVKSINDLEIISTDVIEGKVQKANPLEGYRLSKEDEANILALCKNATPENPITLKFQEVRYDLDAGSGASYEDFELKIKLQDEFKQILISFDDNVVKQKDGTYLYSKKNFKPTRQLRVMYIGTF